jgi:hypothetical protein
MGRAGPIAATNRKVFFTEFIPGIYVRTYQRTVLCGRGWNTPTVALRVVRGDEKETQYPGV